MGKNSSYLDPKRSLWAWTTSETFNQIITKPSSIYSTLYSETDYYPIFNRFSSVQSLSCVRLFATHGLQHARLPCPSPTPRTCSNSHPSSWWGHLTSSSSVAPFSSCLQSFPGSGFFPVSQFFESGGQSIGASASAWVLPMNIQGWFPLDLTPLISLQFKGLSRIFSKPQFKGINSSVSAFFYCPAITSIHDYWKNHNFDYMNLCRQIMSLLY